MSCLERTAIAAALIGVAALAADARVWAQSAPMDAARAACSADSQQFCSGVQPGGGRMLACLKEHRDQVSPGCTQAIMNALQSPAGGAPAPGSAPSAGDATPAPPLPAPPRAQTTPPAKSGESQRTSTAQPAAHGAGGSVRYYQLKRFSTSSKVESHDMTVYSLLAPADWTLAGGVSANENAGSCFSDLYPVSGTVKTSDGTHGMWVIPQSTFRYAEDPGVRRQMEQRDRFDEKFKLKGCPIVAPMHAADFIRENLVWKFHKDKPQVTSEPFPELEQLVRIELGLGPKGGGPGAGSARVEAARVRTSTTSSSGAPIEEWWAAVIVVRTVPVGGRGVGYDWHAEQVTVFQAPKGQLDVYDKVHKVMATSIRLDPQFQKWSVGSINQIYSAWAAEVQKQNAIVAAFQQHVVETIQGVVANQQQGSMVAARGADQLIRGVQTFRDPSSGRTVELSNLYDHAWASGTDQYIVTDDPNFNPNGHVNGNWGELQLVRPQP
jgi:cysteine rich repeat protein